MAHRLLGVVLTVLVLVAVGCGGKSGAAKDPDAPVGKVTAVAGEVSVRRAAAASQPVAVGLVVTRDMVFKTGPGGSLEVRFDNNYTWKLAEERERAIARLRVVDLPAAASAQSVEDDLAGDEQDRTTGAGRHAEQTAAEGASTVEKPAAAAAIEATGGPREPAAAPEKPMAPEVPIVVEEREEEGRAAAAPPPPKLEAAPAPPQPAPPPPKRTRRPPSPGGAGGGATGGGATGGGGRDDLASDSDSDSEKRPAPGAADAAIVKKVLAKKSAAVQACGKQHAASGRIDVRVSLDAAGKLTRVEVQGAHAGTPAGQCIADVVRTISFPALTGATTVTYPFVLPE